MIRFKNWLQKENLAGPGGGPEPSPDSQVSLGKEIARRGAGAFHQGGDNPPIPAKTATAGYLDSRFAKGMKKYMKADSGRRVKEND